MINKIKYKDHLPRAHSLERETHLKKWIHMKLSSFAKTHTDKRIFCHLASPAASKLIAADGLKKNKNQLF